MTQHTPGPWHLAKGEDGEYFAVAGGHESRFKSKTVARLAGPFVSLPMEENNANAKLIAAAPELLAALERLVDWQTITPSEFRQKYGACTTGSLKLDEARAAIAKARAE